MRGREGAWVGWSGDAGDAPEPFDEDGMYLRPVPLSEDEVAEYYEGFSNDTLWPIYHDVIVPATFHRNWWVAYETVNRRFAEAICEVAAEGATVWVHDYQLQLVPADGARDAPRRAHRLVQPHPLPAGRAVRPAAVARAGWSRACWAPTSSASSASPTPTTSCAPAASCSACTPRATPSQPPSRTARRRVVRASAIPISVDFRGLEELARTPRSCQRAKEIRESLGNPETLMLGVDRLDYTKGIRHRLKAYARAARGRRGRAAGPRSWSRSPRPAASGSTPTASCARRSRARSGASTASTATSALPPSTTCTTPTRARRWRRCSSPPTSCS